MFEHRVPMTLVLPVSRMVMQRLRREAAEHDRMQRADARAGLHRDDAFDRHRQIDHHAVPTRDAARAQRVREAAHARMWVLLLMLDHKLFKPDYERSQRIFESEALNRTMVAAAPSGFALLSFEQGNILLQSNLMRTYEANTHPDEPGLHTRLLGLYDRGPGAPAWQSDLEMALRLADGRVDDLLVSMVRTRYRGKEVLLCSFSDITTLKNTERKLDEARAAADAANEAKSAFLAMMSHEIRTPLNAILGNLELLGRSPLSPSQEERVGVITSSSTALLGIINDILDFSKVESGQMTLESISFDLGDVIRQVGAMFEPVAHAGQAVITGSYAGVLELPIGCELHIGFGDLGTLPILFLS